MDIPEPPVVVGVTATALLGTPSGLAAPSHSGGGQAYRVGKNIFAELKKVAFPHTFWQK